MIPQNLFWDSCVFIRYVTKDVNAPYYHDICKFIDETKAGMWKIHFSTVTFAEMLPQYFNASYGDIKNFLRDLGSNFIPIDPLPIVLMQTGELRGVRSTNPGDPNPPAQRAIATPDAIIMLTCLFARDQMGMPDILLHSTDEGRGKGWAGRAVPVIGFERWFPPHTRTPLVDEVCNMAKSLPMHPQPSLLGNVIPAKFPFVNTGP